MQHQNLVSTLSSALEIPSQAYSLTGDYIGMESCFDLDSSSVADTAPYDKRTKQERRCRTRQRSMKKEFPPPIPSLARTENLQSHMPWVLKRYYTNDGRLIIREERVKYHEYFWAQRSNGRLTLHLVPLDHDGDGDGYYHRCDQSADEEIDEQEPEEEVKEEETKILDTNFDNSEKEEDNEITVEDKSLIEKIPIDNGISATSAVKCLNYSPTCFLGIPVPEPVQT